MPEPMYHLSDLNGCVVVTETGEILGVLKDIIPTKANEIYVVKNAEREYLIPAVPSVVTEVDLSGRKVHVHLPPGLREIFET